MRVTGTVKGQDQALVGCLVRQKQSCEVLSAVLPERQDRAEETPAGLRRVDLNGDYGTGGRGRLVHRFCTSSVRCCGFVRMTPWSRELRMGT